jgi:hypothetical protein
MKIRGFRIAIYVRGWGLPARRVGWLGILALNMMMSAVCAVYVWEVFVKPTSGGVAIHHGDEMYSCCALYFSSNSTQRQHQNPSVPLRAHRDKIIR